MRTRNLLIWIDVIFWCCHIVVGLKVGVACSSWSPLRQNEDRTLGTFGPNILTTRQKEFPMSGGGYWIINITVRWWQYGALQIQAHIGIAVNKAEDELAKKATKEGPKFEIPAPESHQKKLLQTASIQR
ncbi:hypothetical protein AVEN_61218-1 [Araneus ventricosus]|uniref:Uncharacterized protein n=1 Tax=Araneus ventricosus TaxID=182803 RepID=A0A4Y2S1D0_ARAVE|nr:hypothetical protein AVEN_61218-1 [Araneus ventricosus]